MPHLVAEVAQDVGAVEALDMAHFLAVQFGELGPRQIERNADRDRAERDAPLGRQIERRRDLRETARRKLAAKFSMTGASRVSAI